MYSIRWGRQPKTTIYRSTFFHISVLPILNIVDKETLSTLYCLQWQIILSAHGCVKVDWVIKQDFNRLYTFSYFIGTHYSISTAEEGLKIMSKLVAKHVKVLQEIKAHSRDVTCVEFWGNNLLVSGSRYSDEIIWFGLSWDIYFLNFDIVTKRYGYSNGMLVLDL